LSECDVLLVTEVYPAGEAPIAGADGRAICRAVRTRGLMEPVFVERVDEVTLDGRQTDVPVVGVFRIENGLVASWREYYDRRQLLGAMGVVEDFDRSAR